MSDAKDCPELKLLIQTAVNNLIEHPLSLFSLKVREAIYTELLALFKESKSVLPELKAKLEQMKLKSTEFLVTAPGLNLENDKEMLDFLQVTNPKDNFLSNFELALTKLTRMLDQGKSNPKTEIGKMSPKFISQLTQWFKSCGIRCSQLNEVQFSDLVSVNYALANFCMKNNALTNTEHFLVRDQRFEWNNVLMKQWTLTVFKNIQTVAESRANIFATWTDAKSKILKYIKDYISTSDEIVGSEDFISCLDMHLSKLIFALQHQSDEDKISDTLANLLTSVEKGPAVTPVEFLINVSRTVNTLSRNVTDLKLDTGKIAKIYNDIQKSVQDHNSDPWNISTLAILLKTNLNLLLTTQDITQSEYILSHLVNAFVFMQEINHKNYQPTDENKEHEKLCTTLAEIFELISNTQETLSESLPDSILELLETLKVLVQSVAERDISILQRYTEQQISFYRQIENSGFSSLQKMLMAVLEELFEIYLHASNYVSSFAAVMDEYSSTLQTKILPKMTKLTSYTELHKNRQLYSEIETLYFECLLKYFNLQSVPSMPTELRATVFHLRSPKIQNQLTIVIRTLQRLVTDAPQEDDIPWLLPFLIVLHKVVGIIPDKFLTSTEIQGVNNLFNETMKQIHTQSNVSDELKKRCKSVILVIQNNLVIVSKKILKTNFMYICQANSVTTQVEMENNFDQVLLQGEQVSSAVSVRVHEMNDFLCQFLSTIEFYDEQISKGDLTIKVHLAGLDWNIQRPIPVLVQINVLKSRLEDLTLVTLKDRFSMDFPPVNSLNCIETLISCPNFNNSWDVVFALIVLSISLNLKEKSFISRSLKVRKSGYWRPENKIHAEEMVLLIKKRYSASEVPEENNQFLQLMLKDVDIMTDEFMQGMISPEERSYISHLFDFTEYLEKDVVTDQLKNLLSKSSPQEWMVELENAAITKVFTKFVDMYVNEFNAALKNLKEVISVDSYRALEKESGDFFESHLENLRNREAFQLQSESLVAHVQSENGDKNQHNANLATVKYFVEQLILLKYNFGRSLFFSKSNNNSDLWFKWMRLLHQRCILRKLPLPELNKLLQRSADLEVSKLIKLTSQTSLQNWMEALYFQIVIENYRAFLDASSKQRLESFNFSNEILQTQEILKAIQSVRNKQMLIILGDKILVEAQLASIGGNSSTSVSPETIKNVLKELSKVEINDVLLDKLEKQGITQWIYYIREQSYLSQYPANVTALILKLESQVGIETSSTFLAAFNKSFPKSIPDLTHFITKITSNKWILDKEVLIKLQKPDDTTTKTSIEGWKTIFQEHAQEVNKRFRDAAEVIRLMREDSINSSLANLLKPGETTVNSTTTPMSLIELQVKEVNDRLARSSEMLPSITDPICDWTAQSISFWSTSINSLPEHERRELVATHKLEVISVLCQGLRVFTSKYDVTSGAVTSPGFLPRDTQLISLLLLIDAFYSNKGRLAEISTGEGKTFITAMMATFRALAGDDVDVITSSPVLAQDNEREVSSYYALFGISVTNNCDKECETEEQARKKRYLCQVIYGDVGSFQRDILLTSFFGKGITMKRTTETVVIDEVDSMLLDKGENILYLFHTIPDLKYLWPLLLEIWQAVHAPDVSRGRLQDINMVVCFIRERIRSGDIFFPNRLQSFISRRLTVWVKNAFIAENLTENDPYVLTDIDKKGAKVVIVDKDTGVEQVSMQWSNGLHQFLQLKHGDKLSPESLKAVFMSNIGYFQQFPGRLYGITGTLGSAAERDLLAQCYSVDFFSMPRFKARKCYEEQGTISNNEREWLASIKEEIQKKTRDEHRAVLIICENIVAVDKIAKVLREIISPSKMYSYKSSFDSEFHKRNRASPLVSGDVIVATNLAGRGTDLKTSKELEGFGGLHVILSYMTANVRIEVQAFGRTARAGLSGTVQFVIQHSHNSNAGGSSSSIEQLRQYRDLKERERLDVFRTRNMQRIEIEEQLCLKFTSLYEKIKAILERCGISEEYTDLQLEFLKNQWALWLESMGERIKVLHIVGKSAIFQDFSNFERDMIAKANSSGHNKYASGAIEMTLLGRTFEQQDKLGDAERCFDLAINMEPNYAEISHYYKAACIIKQTDSGSGSKSRAIHHLKMSEQIIRKRIGQLMTSSKTLETTDSLRRESGKGTASNQFQKQVKNESELYQVHVGKISEAIGQCVDGEFLASEQGIKGVLNKEEGEEIFKALRRQWSIMKNFRMSKKLYFAANDKIYVRNKRGENTEVEWPATFNYCKANIVSFLRTKAVSSSRVIEPEDFAPLVQSQESFWNLIRSSNFLQNERVENIFVIKATKDVLDKIVLPQGNLSDCKSALDKIILANNDQKFSDKLLHPLNLADTDKTQITEILKKHALLESKVNRIANISQNIKDALKWNTNKKQWDGFPTSLYQYRDILEAFIEADKADYDESGAQQQPPSLKDSLSMSDLSLPESNLAASRQLWAVLNESGAIKDCRVNFSVKFADTESKIESRLKDIENALKKNSELKAVFSKYHKAGEQPEMDDVMEVLKTTIGKIKTLPAIEIEYEELEKYFQTGEYPPEIQDFRDMIFMDLLECTEKKSWWDWGAFIVAMLGIAQIIAGVLLEVFTAGAATYLASALISEGMGDIAFAIEAGINKNFSWKSYRDHKIMSLAITIVTAGVGAWLSRGAQVAKFAGKAGFQLFKAVTIRVLKKSIEAVVFKLADIGIDKLLETIQATAIRNCSSEIQSLLLSDPATKAQFALLDKQMDVLFSHSYEHGQAKKLIQDGLHKVISDMQKEGLGVKIMDHASKVTSGIANAMGKASKKLSKHGTRVADQMKFGGGSNALGKAAKLGEVAGVIEKLMKGGEIFKQLTELVNLVPQVLARLIGHLQIQTINLKNSGKGKSTKKTGEEIKEFSTFKEGFATSTREELLDMLLSKINSGLVSPAFQDLTHDALKKAGQAAQKNTSILMSYLRTNKNEETKILKTLRRKDALNEGKISEKLKGKIDLDELDDNTPIKNSDDKTIRELRQAYGDALTVYRDKAGNYFVDRPSFEASIQGLGQGRKAGFYELMICANYYKQTVEISDFSGELDTEGMDGKVKIHPHGKEASANSNLPPLKVAYVKGENGFGYFAPMVDGQIVPLQRNDKDTVTNNLYQSLGFLNKARENGVKVGSDEWDALVEEFNDPKKAKGSVSSISRYALNSKTARFLYEAGAYEAGNKLWDKSGISRGRVFPSRSETGFKEGASDSMEGKSSSSDEAGSLKSWKSNSMEIVKIGDNYTMLDTLSSRNDFTREESWSFQPNMPIIRQQSEINIDFDLLNKSYKSQLNRTELKASVSSSYDLENLQGYPVALIN